MSRRYLRCLLALVAGPVFGFLGNEESSNADVGEVARRMRQSVMVVGDEKVGSGTAWVVSQKHRLLATNAHVADAASWNNGKMSAVINGTKTRLTVSRIWYHPRVLRKFDSRFVLPSMNSKDGDIVVRSPDVAVLELKDEGIPIPPAFPLATPEELKSLLGQPIGLFGFPGHDTESFPKPGELAEATFHAGVVSRVTGFVGLNGTKKQRLQHTASSWKGFSGSPLFLPNGHVIGLHNSRRRHTDGWLNLSIPHGVRVDCLWELLVYHHLADKVGLTKGQRAIDLKRLTQPPTQQEKDIRKAVALVEQAKELFEAEKYSESLRNCDQAISLIPDYFDAYLYRCGNRLYLVDSRWEQATVKDLIGWTRLALNDAARMAKLNPEQPFSLLCRSAAVNRLAELTENTELAKPEKAVLLLVAKVFQKPGADPKWLSRTYQELAYTLYLLEDPQGAVDYANRAVDLCKTWAEPYEARAELWYALGEEQRARTDLRTAQTLRNQKRKTK